MAIFGLSCFDALVSVLLIETAWWTKEFFGITLPPTIDHYYFYSQDYSLLIHTFFLFVIILAKFLVQGILWYALLRNQANEHTRLLKIWCWIGMILDGLLVVMVLSLRLTDARSYQRLFTQLIPFLIVRGGIWALATQLISELSLEKTLFPDEGFWAYMLDRSRIVVTLILLLVWEFFWYAISAVAMVSAYVFGQWNVLFPVPLSINLTLVGLYLLVVLGALFQLIGVVRRWTLFLKLWLPVYILFNICGYGLESFMEFVMTFGFYSSYAHWIQIGTNLICPLCALGLKLSIVACTFKLLWRTDTAVENNDEEKPLIDE